MKIHLLIIWAILFVISCQTVAGQKVLLLQKPGKAKRFLYHPGDKIAVRLGEPEFTVSGEITFLDDSLCTVNKNYTFQLAKVKEVEIVRFWFYASWPKFLVASLAYAGGSMINRAAHDEKPLIDNTIPVVSGSFIALGIASHLLRYRHCKMEKDWHLKVLDFDIYKSKPELKE